MNNKMRKILGKARSTLAAAMALCAWAGASQVTEFLV